MRRFFYFVFPVLILVMFSFSSAEVSAVDVDDSIDCIDVLSYDYPDHSLSVLALLTSERPYNYFDLPFSYSVSYFDVIIKTTGYVPLSTGIRDESGLVFNLTTVSLGNNRYRCYGSYSGNVNSLRFGFQVESASSSYYIFYEKFDIYTMANTGVGDLGEMNLTPNADTSVSSNYWYRQTSPGVPIVQDFYYFSSGVQFFEYNALFSSVNWRKYDYLDFTFQISASTIDYISAYIKTSDNIYRYLSFDISFINGSAIDKNEFVGSGTTTVIPAGSQWDIVMRVYVPSSYRLSGSLFIDVGGQYKNHASRAFLQSVNGYCYVTAPDPSLVKLDQITAAIKESISSSAEDNAAAEDFSNEMSDKKEQMSSNQQVIDSVNRPSSSDLGMISASDVVLDQSGMGYLTSIISPITNHKIVLAILTLSATLALVSYVFFGKKR